MSTKFRIMAFNQPAQTNNHEGKIRRIGFEIEYTGLSIEELVPKIRERFGGTVVEKTRFYQKIKNTAFGDLKIELDVQLLKHRNYQKELKKIGIDLESVNLAEEADQAVESIASIFVPYEVILPPLPLNQLELVEELRELLHKNKIKGTRSSIIYAFALQINIEIPEISASVILNYLRAFILLREWITKQSKIDFTREYLTGFINDYPDKYKLIILRENYAPSMEEFVADYKYYNNTRNRPVDIYPLLAYINADYAKGIEKEKLVKARPALHYRFPNCLLDDPNWRIAHEWNRWVEVDNLAWNGKKLTHMSRDFIALYHAELFFKNKWIKWVESKYFDE